MPGSTGYASRSRVSLAALCPGELPEKRGGDDAETRVLAGLAAVVVLLPLAARPADTPRSAPIGLDDLAGSVSCRTRSARRRALVVYTVDTVDVEKDKRDTDVWMTPGRAAARAPHLEQGR